ncbi:MAG: ATP-binding cassette domain-containing protein [Gemmatimonadota bacterium]|nr:ATP-binding cassette domain-containing protein [Gemmatimonadota bacterium]
MSDHALVLRAVSKQFGAVRALAGASLTVRRGTLHAVLGENGAGKTTLMRIAFGMMAPDEGEVEIDGRPVTLSSSAAAIALGLGMVHQHFTLVPAMSAAENIALGGRGRLDLGAVAEQVRVLSARTGLAVDPDTRVDALGVGAQQRIEILKALHGNARTLILDEPTAVLTPTESEELFGWLRRFVAEGGTAVLVTHKLQEALSVADDVTVLRRGERVLTARAAEIDIVTLVRALTGEDRAPETRVRTPRSQTVGAVVAQLTDVSVRDARGVLRVHQANVTCHAGEIIGVAGVEGSGVHELLRVLAGRLTPTAGTVSLPDTVGFVPEDRLRDAVIEDFSLSENFALRGAAARRGRMPWPELRAHTARAMAAHDVRAPSPDVRAGTLSGGNQQKFVVGREMENRPALVIAENPVRGLDLRATEHVLRELAASAASGSAVVIFSTDVDELLPLADRMLVTFAGQVREVPVVRDAIARALVGAA